MDKNIINNYEIINRRLKLDESEVVGEIFYDFLIYRSYYDLFINKKV